MGGKKRTVIKLWQQKIEISSADYYYFFLGKITSINLNAFIFWYIRLWYMRL